MTKIIVKILILTCCVIAFFSPVPVKAISDPPLFSCSQPVGSIIAQHNEGEHGVAGNSNNFSGSDIVYKIDENFILQCLCPPNSEGIASNWWKVNSLSKEEIDFFIRRGWVFVANGEKWGLSSSSYLVHNSNYSCKPGLGGAVLGNTISDNKQRGKILGVSSFAATGSYTQLILFLGLGFSFAWLTYKLNKS